MTILWGLEFLGELVIDAADLPLTEAVLKHLSVAGQFLGRELAHGGLDSEPFDEMHDEFIYGIPLHWYWWAVNFVQEHQELYPSHVAASYDRLMDVAARFNIQPAGDGEPRQARSRQRTRS